MRRAHDRSSRLLDARRARVSDSKNKPTRIGFSADLERSTRASPIGTLVVPNFSFRLERSEGGGSCGGLLPQMQVRGIELSGPPKFIPRLDHQRAASQCDQPLAS